MVGKDGACDELLPLGAQPVLEHVKVHRLFCVGLLAVPRHLFLFHLCRSPCGVSQICLLLPLCRTSFLIGGFALRKTSG